MFRLRTGIATLGIASVALGGVLLANPPTTAHANSPTTSSSAQAALEELQVRVQQASEAYDTAIANLDALNSQAAENQEKISAVEAEIPLQREKSKGAIRTLYKLGQGQRDMLDLALSAEDFNSFISTITYFNSLEEKHTQEANKLIALNEELNAAQESLASQQSEAEAQKKAADEALKQAEALRQEAVEQAAREAEAEARAKAQAEEAARRKAAEEAQRQAEETAKKEAEAAAQASQSNGASAPESSAPESQSPSTPAPSAPAETPAPSETPAPAPSEPAPSTPEPETPAEPEAEAPAAPEPSGNSDRDAFVSEWTARIDAYLAGSPLAGYGYAFAEAAYDNNVDPRWSPAISCTESGKGAACFRPCNAWGWGNVSWPDWDTAIRAHVAGLASGYGYTISPEAAQKYCPPTWQDWYDATSYQMSLI